MRHETLFPVVPSRAPPCPANGRWAPRLEESDERLAWMAKPGGGLVLHGHDHRHATVWIDGPGKKIPAIGVPSASAMARGYNQPAAYNLFSIEAAGEGWRCDRRVRGFTNSMTMGDIKNERLF